MMVFNGKFNKGQFVELKNRENPLLEKEISEYLKKGIKQRDIASLTKMSLPTVNKYCQRIQKKEKMEQKQERERKRAIKERVVKAKEISISKDEPISEAQIKENTMRVFNEMLVEIRVRIPTMTNAELRQTTIDIWDKIK